MQAHLRKRAHNGYKNIYGVDGLIVGSNQYTGAPITLQLKQFIILVQVL